jgi:hypothetical protein
LPFSSLLLSVIGLGKGDFQNVLGNNVNVETFQFNAGP